MIRRHGWKYAWYTGDRDELYHFEEDPLELENRVTDPECRANREELRDRLTAWLLAEPMAEMQRH